MSSTTARAASHAGSWYTDNGPKLASQLQKWIDDAKTTHTNVKAVISPHAGFSYSGKTAGYSFRHIDPDTTKRIFVLGPSHHVYTRVCNLSQTDVYETPVGDIPLDKKVIAELKKEKNFSTMSVEVDEDEHSIEMQLPFIAHIMAGREYTLVPIMVGSTSYDMEQYYGKVLSKYFDEEGTVFVISSDFCHWGSRFNYTYYDKSKGEIWESITALDHLGMDEITSLDPKRFAEYQAEYKNTVCGRHPISVLLHIIQHSKLTVNLDFVAYDQSSKVKSQRDSSVSYAAGVVSIADK